MKLVITIPKAVEQALKQEVKAWAGRAPTPAEMERFFRRDIQEMYFQVFTDSLADAVEAGWKQAK
jgi:hypothetical protein